MKKGIRHINPGGLFRSPVFSQGVTTQGPGTTIYIGGQNAVNTRGDLVGENDLGKQTEQAMENIRILLTECDATFSDLVKLTIYIVQGEDLQTAFKNAQPFLAEAEEPPAVTFSFVSGLTNPKYLVEIDGIAFVEAGRGND
jgi:enamine deaminase RidA (YjgF/YER057c/UK114 family)